MGHRRSRGWSTGGPIPVTHSVTSAEARAMDRALELARAGWGRVEPNPLVGCVLLQDDEIVGEGYHPAFGGEHAEVMALQAAGERAAGATAVVTLEPCIHHGKTPPCVDALHEAGITRVVVASRDPTARAAGGLERLGELGMDLVTGLREREARSLNASFFILADRGELPFVALKLATSLDGRIADAQGNSKWISGAEALEWVHWLRAGFDAIAVGGATARRDDPQLTVRGPVTPRKPPTRVVFDRGALLNPGTALVRTAGTVSTWVVASEDAPAANVALLESAGARVLRSGDLRDGLAMLRREGISRVLCEGGGHLGGSLLSGGFVDRLYWIQAPIWLGARSVSAFVGLPDCPIESAARWSVAERRALGEDTLLVVDREPCSRAS